MILYITGLLLYIETSPNIGSISPNECCCRFALFVFVCAMLDWLLYARNRYIQKHLRKHSLSLSVPLLIPALLFKESGINFCRFEFSCRLYGTSVRFDLPPHSFWRFWRWWYCWYCWGWCCCWCWCCCWLRCWLSRWLCCWWWCWWCCCCVALVWLLSASLNLVIVLVIW